MREETRGLGMVSHTINRLEVVTYNGGRELIRYDDSMEVIFSFQDDDNTLKVFVVKRQGT